MASLAYRGLRGRALGEGHLAAAGLGMSNTRLVAVQQIGEEARCLGHVLFEQARYRTSIADAICSEDCSMLELRLLAIIGC